MKAYLYFALAVLLAITHWLAYTTGREHSDTACTASRAVDQGKVQTAIDLRDTSASEVQATILDYLRVTIPAMERVKYETITRVQKVYVDRLVPSGCDYPDGVQAEIDAARERANRAASGLRPIPAATIVPDPGIVGAANLGHRNNG